MDCHTSLCIHSHPKEKERKRKERSVSIKADVKNIMTRTYSHDFSGKLFTNTTKCRTERVALFPRQKTPVRKNSHHGYMAIVIQVTPKIQNPTIKPSNATLIPISGQEMYLVYSNRKIRILERARGQGPRKYSNTVLHLFVATGIHTNRAGLRHWGPHAKGSRGAPSPPLPSIAYLRSRPPKYS